MSEITKKIIDYFLNQPKTNCFPVKNIADVSSCIGVSESDISNNINKYPLLFIKSSEISKFFTLSVFVIQVIKEYYCRYDTEINLTGDTSTIINPCFTSSFADSELLRFFNLVKPSSILTKKHFETYKDKCIAAFNKYSKEDISDRYCWPENIESYIEKFKVFENQKGFSMALLYANGYTLEEIGDYNGFTRERARVILKNFFSKLTRWIIDFSDDFSKLANDKNILDNEKCESIFSKNGWKVISYTISKTEDSHIILASEPSLNLVFVCPDYKKIKENIFVELNKETNYFDLIQSFEQLMCDNGISAFNNDNIKEYIEKEQLNFPNAGIKHGTIKRNAATIAIIQKYYPDGVDLKSSEELNNILNQLTDYFGFDPNDDSEKKLIIRLRALLKKAASGKYVIELSQVVDKDITTEIVDYIYAYNEKYVPLNFIFNKFSSSLARYNITKPEQIKAILKLESYPNLTITKHYIINSNINNDSRYVALANSLLKKPMSFDEIAKEFPVTYSDLAIVKKYQPIVSWKNNTFYNISALKISDTSKKALKDTINNCLSNIYGYTNSSLLYNKVSAEIKDETIISLTKEQLFALCKYLYGDVFLFSSPHILKDNSKESFSMGELIEKIIHTIEEHETFDISLLYDTIFQLCGKESYSLCYLALTNILKDYVRISEELFCHKSLFSASSIEKEKITDIIKSEMINGVLKVSDIKDFSAFPSVSTDVKWNVWMLVDIIRLYNLPFKYISDSINYKGIPAAIIYDPSLNFKTKLSAIGYQKNTKNK